MLLKSIKAYGFKSFADKIDIEFKSNVTAIVGPNGSGKSNIVDAVRWVLGEQSVKSLRGNGTMTDCIFAGSKTREALKRAEVELTFDNKEHFLNSELLEIQVKRIVYHTGENEYFLNNSKVRLKDITNLFLDSGAGINSFNIISQGSIESIINSKPEERRVIIEEAASVLKYKKRKEESLRKLEKTSDNLEKVGLILHELETTIFPLKEQAIFATKYLNLKKELEDLEIAFIASDIKSKNNEYQTLKNEVEELEKTVLNITSLSTAHFSEIEQIRMDYFKTEEEIKEKNTALLELTKTLAEKNSEKEITMERQKYTISETTINEQLMKNKEEELKISKETELLKMNIDELEIEISKFVKELGRLEENISLEELKQKNGEMKKNTQMRELWEIKNKIDILENNIQNDAFLPYAVKNVLNNTRLQGIHGTISKLIKIEEIYSQAIEVSLGFSSNFIVVDTELDAKKAIIYLKENHLGRATFFPLNVIKGKKIEENIQKTLVKEEGFLGIASDLVKYEKEYQNIIENQLGNILVVKDIDTMNRLGKKLMYRYRIVSLDGEILHTGGSLSGGSSKKTNSSFNDQIELEKLKTREKSHATDIERLTVELQKMENSLANFKQNSENIQKQIFMKQEKMALKNDQYSELKQMETHRLQELDGMNSLLSDTLDTKLVELLEKIQELEKNITILEKNLANLQTYKSECNSKIANFEQSNRQKMSEQNKIESECKTKEIQIGKIDIQLDNLLTTLSENYNLTFEKAIREYPLEMEYDIAKEKVAVIKKEMISLGNVNLGSIEEYNRLSVRYDFLLEQKTDLEHSMNSLEKVIEEMDEIMKTRFSETFQKVSEEFSIVYKKLFKGGNGLLKMTNPENILETGIDIIAEPPGKKLNNINQLSGGEKTLTAISLLFAILNIKPVPFCILDEIEAALDEANVDTFGNYLQKEKAKSEFILITHKKRTMEYADTLYGITMQESGVSKIVSVELENI